MKRIFTALLAMTLLVNAETLFQVTDSLNNKVLDISTDGLRVFNLGDTLMVISASTIQANISNSKGLSRTFSVTTSSSKGKGLKTNVFEVDTDSTSMREGSGLRYTNFSPDNMFLGLNSGINTVVDVMGGGVNNVFLGNYTGHSNTGGSQNIFIGYQSGYSNQYGTINTYVGDAAGFYNSSGSGNVFVGGGAGTSGTGGSYNTFLGTHAGYYSAAQGNTFTGYESGFTTNSGESNSYYGEKSGYEGTEASFNSVFGKEAGYKNKTGDLNSVFGYQAGYGATNNSYSNNSLFGAYSGKVITTGSSNSMFGYGSGYKTTTGLNNVFVGDSTGFNNISGSGNLFIGSNAGYSETASNKLYIANSSTSTPLIKGTFPNTDLTFTAAQVYVKHPTGTSNGLYIHNSDISNNWHFYGSNGNNLNLYYNTSYRGYWDYTSGAYTATSDLKLKKNIENLGSVTDKVMKLQPKRYNFSSQKDSERKYIGLIAQDVKELFPEFVYYNEEEGLYTMDYSGLSVVAIQAVKELKQENDELKKRISALEEMKAEIEIIKEKLSIK